MRLNKKKLKELREKRSKQDGIARQIATVVDIADHAVFIIRCGYSWTSWVCGRRGFLIPTGVEGALLRTCHDRTSELFAAQKRSAMRSDTSKGTK